MLTNIQARLVHLFEVCCLFHISNLENVHHLERGHPFTHDRSFTFKASQSFFFSIITLLFLNVFFRIYWLVMERATHMGVFQKAGVVKALSMLPRK